MWKCENELPDQCNCSFFEEWPVEIVDAFYDPHKGIGGLRFAADRSIPSLSVYNCTEDELAPAVKYFEVFYLFNTYCNRPEYIVQVISIRRKCRRHKNLGICFEYFYQHACR